MKIKEIKEKVKNNMKNNVRLRKIAISKMLDENDVKKVSRSSSLDKKAKHTS